MRTQSVVSVLLPACLSFGLLLASAMPAQASTVFTLNEDTQVIGSLEQITSRYEDTLVDIGRRHKLGFEELRLANPGVDPWLPGEGKPVALPSAFVLPRSARRGVVINIAEYRLYFYYEHDGVTQVATAPVSIGRMDWATPLGRTRIVGRSTRPSWYPPQSVREEYEADGRELPRVVPPGPNNPLGNYAIRLGLPGYLIHGTNRPAGVGMQVTHGCIRMFPEDIEWLFPRTAVDMAVEIINQPVKFGWQGNELFLEVHPALEAEGTEPLTMTTVTRELVYVTEQFPADIDWDLVVKVYRERLGVPVRVGSRRPDAVAAEDQQTAAHKKAAANAAAFSG